MALSYNSGIWCDIKIGERTCSRHHHSLLYDVWNQNSNGNVFNVHDYKGDTAVLAIGTASCSSQPVSVLYDSGSDITLIRHKKTRELDIQDKD